MKRIPWKKIGKAVSGVGLVAATAAVTAVQDPTGPVAAVIPPEYAPLWLMGVTVLNTFLPPLVTKKPKSE